MRKLIYFALLVTVIPLFAACKKSISTGSQENFEHYIFFGHQVESKASLINRGEDVTSFGVVGFKYDNTTSWDEYKTKTECTPNVFFDEYNSPVDVETLNCTKGSPPSYTPLQGWSNTRKYTFFAFYPIGNKNVDIVSANGSEYKGGVPAIKYSLKTKDSMVDVMVSEPCKDLYYNSSEDNNLQGEDNNLPGSEVKLKFNHILSALGVNFTKKTENTITINGVSMTISGIQYQTYIYPLDGAAAPPPGGSAMDEKSFALSIPEGVEVVSEIAGTEIADKLIFIPQSEKATISLTIEYIRSAGGVSFKDVKSFTDIKTAFEAGKKHLIQLKFTDSTVEVKSDVTSGVWTVVEEVNNTFN